VANLSFDELTEAEACFQHLTVYIILKIKLHCRPENVILTTTVKVERAIATKYKHTRKQRDNLHKSLLVQNRELITVSTAKGHENSKRCCFCDATDRLGEQTASMLKFLMTHTHTHTHRPSRSRLNERSARRRGRYLNNTQQTQQTSIYIFSGIRIRDPNNPAVHTYALTAWPLGSVAKTVYFNRIHKSF
jgi:hypothetical protein